MAAVVEEIEAQALSLSIKERSELIHRLIVSLDGDADGPPEEIARAWEEEIARRVAEMDAGKTQWVSAESVISELRALIDNAKPDDR